MTLEKLLEVWANWSLSTSQGYSETNILYRMMNIPKGNNQAKSLLPYGVDVDEVCSRLDRIINRLPARRRQVLCAEYLCNGTQEQKACRLTPPMARETFTCHLNLAKKQLSTQPDVNCLLKYIDRH